MENIASFIWLGEWELIDWLIDALVSMTKQTGLEVYLHLHHLKH